MKNRIRKRTSNKGKTQLNSKISTDRWLNFFSRWQNRIEDLIIILLSALSIVSVFGLLKLTEGELIDPWISFIRRWLGWGAWIVPLSFGLVVVWLVQWKRGGVDRFFSFKLIAFELFVIGGLALLAIFC